MGADGGVPWADATTATRVFEDADLAAYERRFRRAGMPLLIEDYDAYEDVFTRAVPLLAPVFGAQLLGAVTLEWPWWANALALTGGLTILLGTVAVLNRRRGRPVVAIPERVGKAELAAFIFVPALLPLVFGGQVLSAAVTAAGNVLLLLAVYLVVGFGVLSIVRWAVGRLVGQLAASLLLLTRAVPVLLVFMIVLFVNTEIWQVCSSARGFRSSWCRCSSALSSWPSARWRSRLTWSSRGSASDLRTSPARAP